MGKLNILQNFGRGGGPEGPPLRRCQACHVKIPCSVEFFTINVTIAAAAFLESSENILVEIRFMRQYPKLYR